MSRKKLSLPLLLLFLVSFSLTSCVDSLNRDIEEIQFLLDAGDYDEAIRIGENLISEDSTNREASVLLASAYLGRGSLSGGAGCQDEDTGVVGLLACVVDSRSNNESNLETFSRIAPPEERISDVERAVELLSASKTEVSLSTDEVEFRDISLKLFVARIFFVSSGLTFVGATSENQVCNSNENAPLKDDVPDEYDSSVITEDYADEYLLNLETLNQDGADGGFPSDFDLFSRIVDIRQEIEDIPGAPTLTNEQLLEAYFDSQFQDGKETCDQTI